MAKADNETAAGQADKRLAPIHFGTDGWRAVIGEDFNEGTVARVAGAAAKVFSQDHPGQTVLVAYDCRRDAGIYAAQAARILAGAGLKVKLSNAYCPTPTLCWSVAHDDSACGGMILTSSHNPAQWLGIKLRMADGGASPKEFTDRVEALISDELTYPEGEFETVDFETPYQENLLSLVDVDAIRAAHLHVVLDPLYGAQRGYLKDMLERIGVAVDEIHSEADPTFGGLHPEPIIPWVNEACARVKEIGADAGFITDGDGDRVAAVDSKGNFVNPHRILCLVVEHLATDRGEKGRVVTTMSGSTMVRLQAQRFGLPYTVTPVGFKWIYGEMLKGDVMVGGEESGGIGIPWNVRERDGALMTMMLCELMACRGKKLEEILDEMFAEIGEYSYKRRDLTITQEQKDAFLAAVPSYNPSKIAGYPVEEVSHLDGMKAYLPDGAWLLMRPSGTEPLVRIYAESKSPEQVEELLDAGSAFAKGEAGE